MSSQQEFDSNVFVNCPFDEEYYKLLRPLLFTVVFFGYNPRIASESSDSGENRIDKILGLIRNSGLSIHDLSRIRASKAGDFSRMNMPFELGVDYGARIFGPKRMQNKRCLILEKERYDTQKALSDLGGADFKNHDNDPEILVRATLNWFVETVGSRDRLSPTKIWYQFVDFASDFHDARKSDGFTDDDLNMMPVPEYIDFIKDWVSTESIVAGQ